VVVLHDDNNMYIIIDRFVNISEIAFLFNSLFKYTTYINCITIIIMILYCGIARLLQSRNVIKSTHRPLTLVPGWVITPWFLLLQNPRHTYHQPTARIPVIENQLNKPPKSLCFRGLNNNNDIIFIKP